MTGRSVLLSVSTWVGMYWILAMTGHLPAIVSRDDFQASRSRVVNVGAVVLAMIRDIVNKADWRHFREFQLRKGLLRIHTAFQTTI